MDKLIIDIYKLIFSHLHNIDIVYFQSTCHAYNKIFYPLFYDKLVEMEYFNIIPNYILVSEHKNKNLAKYTKYSKCTFDFTNNLISSDINLINHVKSAIISNTFCCLELYCSDLLSLIVYDINKNLKITAPKLEELYIGPIKNLDTILIISPKLKILSCYSPKYLSTCVKCDKLNKLHIYGEIDENDIIDNNINLYICINHFNANNVPKNIKKLHIAYDIEILNLDILKINYLIEIKLIKYNYLNYNYVKCNSIPYYNGLFVYLQNTNKKIPLYVNNSYPSYKKFYKQYCHVTNELNMKICYNDIEYQGVKFNSIESTLFFVSKKIEVLNIDSKKSKLTFSECDITEITINQIMNENYRYGLIREFQNTIIFNKCNINTCYIDGYHDISIVDSFIDNIKIIHYKVPNFANQVDSSICLKNTSIRKITLFQTKLICTANVKITILEIDNDQEKINIILFQTKLICADNVKINILEFDNDQETNNIVNIKKIIYQNC